MKARPPDQRTESKWSLLQFPCSQVKIQYPLIPRNRDRVLCPMLALGTKAKLYLQNRRLLWAEPANPKSLTSSTNTHFFPSPDILEEEGDFVFFVS